MLRNMSPLVIVKTIMKSAHRYSALYLSKRETPDHDAPRELCELDVFDSFGRDLVADERAP